MNMETGYELNVPVGDGNKDVKAIISNNEVIWERAIPTPKSGVAPLSFRATRAKPLLDWGITGKTYQAWTPSPEPQIGNNKLDNSKIEKSATVTNFAYTDSSVSFGSMTVGSVINSAEIKAEDTSYAFSFTGDTNKVTFALRCYNSSHTYLGDANKIFDESSRAVMTTLANTTYVRLYITTTVQGNISLTNLMLNKGNTVMAFEPFGYLPNTGICYVQGVGDKTQNLFDKNNYTQASDALKFKCDLVIGSLYTVKNYSDKPIIVKISNNRDGYSSVQITYQPMESSTFVMTKHPNIPQSETQYIFIRVDGVWVTDISQLNGIDIMLNEGTEPLPYEPYGYKIPVVSKGKNLFDIRNTQNNTTLNITTGLPETYYGNRRFATPNPIYVNAEKYTISFKTKFKNAAFLYSAFDSNNNLIERKTGYKTGSTITVPTNGKKMYLCFYEASDTHEITVNEINDIQIELGDTATEYEPYIEPKTSTIYLPSPLMADEVLKSEGSREVEWGKRVLTGKEKVENQTGRYDTESKTMLSIPDFTLAKLSQVHKTTHFRWYTTAQSQAAPAGTFAQNSLQEYARYFYFNISNDVIGVSASSTSVEKQEAFKAWLKSEYDAGHPVTVWYQLATPTSETVTVPAIPTLKGNNVIDINTEVQPSNISITYLSSGFEPQPLKTADGQMLYTNNNQPLNTLE